LTVVGWLPFVDPQLLVAVTVIWHDPVYPVGAVQFVELLFGELKLPPHPELHCQLVGLPDALALKL